MKHNNGQTGQCEIVYAIVLAGLVLVIALAILAPIYTHNRTRDTSGSPKPDAQTEIETTVDITVDGINQIADDICDAVDNRFND